MEDIITEYQKTFTSNHPVSYINSLVKESFSKSNSEEIRKSNYAMESLHRNELSDFTVNREYLNSEKTYLERGLISDQSISFTKFEGNINFVSVTANDLDEQRRNWLSHKGLGSILDGVVRGSYLKTLPEVLKEEQDLKYSITKEVLDNKNIILAKFDTKYGIYKVWLDPAMDYCPRKIVIEKHSNKKHFKKIVGKQPKPIPDGVREFFPNETIDKITITAYPVILEKVAGRFFPVSAKILESTCYENGMTSKIEADFSQKIDLNPDFEKFNAFKFKPGEIPNGTQVYFDDERDISGLKYEWHNGSYRAAVDLEELELVNNTIIKYKENQPKNLTKTDDLVCKNISKGSESVSKSTDLDDQKGNSLSKRILGVCIISGGIILFILLIFARRRKNEKK